MPFTNILNRVAACMTAIAVMAQAGTGMAAGPAAKVENVGPNTWLTLTFDNPAVPIIDATMANEAMKLYKGGSLAGKENLWVFIRRADDMLYLKARYAVDTLKGLDWVRLSPGNGPFLNSADDWQVRNNGIRLFDAYCTGSTRQDIPRLCAKAGL